jgi:hypothetical protein
MGKGRERAGSDAVYSRNKYQILPKLKSTVSCFTSSQPNGKELKHKKAHRNMQARLLHVDSTQQSKGGQDHAACPSTHRPSLSILASPFHPFTSGNKAPGER